MKKLLCIALSSAVATGWAMAAGAEPTASAGAVRVPSLLLTRADDGIDFRHGRGADDGTTHKSRRLDDPIGHDRRGRGADLVIKRQGADDPPGDDRRGRGRDDLVHKRMGADDPAGDDRRGRGADDPANHH